MSETRVASDAAKMMIGGLIRRGIATLALLAAIYGAAAPHVLRAADDSQPPPGAADDSDPAVKSGREALRSPDRFPWYDAKNDKLRRVTLRRVEVQNYSKRKPDDEDHPYRPDRAGEGRDDGTGDGSNPPPDNSSPPPAPMSTAIGGVLMWMAWIVIIGLLVALAVALIRAFLNREAREARQSAVEGSEAGEDDQRLDALPAGPVRAKGGLLEEAQRNYEAGNYREAIIYLYSYQLMKLDQNQWIRLARGKTNREYLRELAGRPELQSLLARTMIPFEDVFFGDYPLDQARFEACWREVDRFHRLIQQAAV